MTITHETRPYDGAEIDGLMQFPSALVVEQSRFFKPGGKVLDVGCGTGRNTLFLAGRGFLVAAIDQNASAITDLKNRTVGLPDDEQLRLTPSVQNMIDWDPGDVGYSAMLAIYSLRFVGEEHFYGVLKRMMDATQGGGRHVLQDIASPNPQNPDEFWPGNQALADVYESAGWTIETYGVEMLPTVRTDANGLARIEPVETFVAQR